MEDNRTQLNIKIDTKTHWIATLCARHQGVTLAEFVKHSIQRGITRGSMLANGEVAAPSEPMYDSLWSEDEATRVFHVAAFAFDLLTDSQSKTFASISAAVAGEGKKLTLNVFKQHYALQKGAK